MCFQITKEIPGIVVSCFGRNKKGNHQTQKVFDKTPTCWCVAHNGPNNESPFPKTPMANQCVVVENTAQWLKIVILRVQPFQLSSTDAA